METTTAPALQAVSPQAHAPCRQGPDAFCCPPYQHAESYGASSNQSRNYRTQLFKPPHLARAHLPDMPLRHTPARVTRRAQAHQSKSLSSLDTRAARASPSQPSAFTDGSHPSFLTPQIEGRSGEGHRARSSRLPPHDSRHLAPHTCRCRTLQRLPGVTAQPMLRGRCLGSDRRANSVFCYKKLF